MNFIDDLGVYREGVLAFGFWGLQIYRFGTLRYRFKSKFIRYPLAAIHIVLSKMSEMAFGIIIGESAIIGRRLIIEHSGGIVIHGQVVIGDDCIIRQGVTIGNRLLSDPSGAPVLGNRVNVGAGAKILGRITIGDNVEIGANAVVIKDVPADSIAVGVPARIIKKKGLHPPASVDEIAQQYF